MRAPDLPHSESFPWAETSLRLERLLERGPLEPERAGRWYEQRDEAGTLRAALRPPLVLLGGEGLPPAEALARRAGEGPGRYAILLLQAGAAALGLFDTDDMLDHKAQKRYVVRGKGRAQPTHLKTRGKSRYGSRLRLRNAERLLTEVTERLSVWWQDDDPPARLFVSCPQRLYADLSRVEPPTPVPATDPRRVKIPIDVHVPSHAELLRVQRSISRGRAFSGSPPKAS